MAGDPRSECWLVARSPAPEITEAVGEALARHLVAGSLVGLVGELGAGKTALVRGLARGLGIPSGVTSPTFTRMVVHHGRLPLYHFDAWREGSRELLADAQEYLSGDGVAVVEWADQVEEFLPRPRLELRLAHLTNGGAESRALEFHWIPAPAGAPPRIGADLERALRAATDDVRRNAGLEIA